MSARFRRKQVGILPSSLSCQGKGKAHESVKECPGRCLRNSFSQEPSSLQLVYIASYRHQYDANSRNHRLLRVLHSEEDIHVRNESRGGDGVLLLCVGGLDFPSVLLLKQFFTCFLSYLVE